MSNNLNSYMNNVIISGNISNTIPEKKFQNFMDQYTLLFQKQSEYIIRKVFGSILKNENIKVDTVNILLCYIKKTNKNDNYACYHPKNGTGHYVIVDKLVEALLKIKTSKSTKRYHFIPLVIYETYDKNHNAFLNHQNMLIFDNVSDLLYKLDPDDDGAVRSRRVDQLIPGFLKQVVVKYNNLKNLTNIKYIGSISNVINCKNIKNILNIQKHLKGNFCVPYSLFIVYLLSNINKYHDIDLKNIFKNKKNNIHIFNVALLHHDKLRYIFVMFVEKLYDLYFTTM